jgi:hypothetical protein
MSNLSNKINNANSENTTLNIFAKFKLIAPAARTTNKIVTRTSKRDTLPDARQKVIDKLNLNKAYFNDPSQDKPDLVYKSQSDGIYAIGAKYGNRYLQNIFGTTKFLENVDETEVAAVLDELAQCVSDGVFDSAIDEIRLANVGARNNKQH